MGFTTLGLSDRLLQGVQAAGYTVPTPIQSLAIRPILEGKDLIGCAQTGTGKTAAFVLPMLHHLAADDSGHQRHRHPRALVLTPTRELAQQVRDAVTTYGKFLHLRSIAIYGGVGMENQVAGLNRGADIVIATPGRLLDHMQRGSIHLGSVRILVLDEADRMLDMGFIQDVRRIVGAVPKERQTLLFSATVSDDITKLASGILKDPVSVEAGERRTPAETVEQHFYRATRDAKIDLLLHALEAEKMESVLIFSRTKHGADKISRRLERQGVSSVAIHSNRTQPQRERALEGFRAGKFRVLVATDIAARGIDVDGISHVINYDIPHYAEDYVHRIGRTGRAGAAGDAVTFVSPDDADHLRKIERYTGRHYTVKTYPGFTARPAAAASEQPHQPRQSQSSERHPRQPLSSERPATRPAHPPGRHPRPDNRLTTQGAHQTARKPRPSGGQHARPGQAPAHRPGSGTVSGYPGRRTQPQGTSPHPPKGKKQKHTDRRTLFAGRKRKKGTDKKLDSFSSDFGGPAWSNY
jgi:ATP-dependent RNA helicase RhlE